MPSSRPAHPLPTLLSQALVAFTVEFDNLAAARITAAGTRPALRSHLAALRPRGAVRADARGVEARDRGAARGAAVEHAIGIPRGCQLRVRQALDAVLASPALAAGLEPPPGCWRGRPPYLAQTQRVLADPRAALPHQPPVLHRGGFPDGA